MLCKCHWIMLYTVHFTTSSLGGRFFPDTVYYLLSLRQRIEATGSTGGMIDRPV